GAHRHSRPGSHGRSSAHEKAPALRPGLLLRIWCRSGLAHVHCTGAAFGLLNFERDLIAFEKVRTRSCLVNEKVLSAFNRGDESKTFLRIEEFHCTIAHVP